MASPGLSRALGSIVNTGIRRHAARHAVNFGSDMREVTNGELPRYIELLATKFYPRSIVFSNTAMLKMNHKVKASFMVDEWPKIGCTLMRLPRCEMDGNMAFLLTESQGKLEKFLVELNYNGDALIGTLDDETGEHLKCMVKSWPFGLEEKILAVSKAYHYPGKTEDLIQRPCPEGTYVAELQPEHAEFISDFWAYGKPEARKEYLKYIIKTCGSVGVFLKSDPTHPVSWSLLSNFGHIMHVHTLEEHQGKGYGRITVVHLMQQMLEVGLTPALEVVIGNLAAAKLFTGLGFVESFNAKWKQFV